MKGTLLYLALLFSSIVSYAQSISCTLDDLKGELQSCPQKAGSSYYAYPGPLQSLYTPAPEGFSPIYISHYGRHGSRWVTSDSRYRFVIDILDANKLTPTSRLLREKLERVWQDVQGRGGDLTIVGERQHQDIAVRMYANFPTIFANNANIRAYASTSRRCMMSMMAFCESLKEQNPNLNISRSAHERDMSFINYESPELKAFVADSSSWSRQYASFCSQNISTSRLMYSLFVSPSEVSQQLKFMEELYWIVENQQDTSLNLDLFSFFTDEELFAIWKTVNCRMYVTNSGSPLNNGIPASCANNLLNNIIQCADESLANGNTSATLRFGHDSALIKLLTLMNINGVNAKVSSLDDIYLSWQDFRISPMAANLQIIFYQNAQHETIVKILLNENEVTLPISSESAPYYNWSTLKKYWQSTSLY